MIIANQITFLEIVFEVTFCKSSKQFGKVKKCSERMTAQHSHIFNLAV